MFACLFLPAMRTCGTPDYPLHNFPYFTAPYFFGIVVAVTAFVVGPRTLRMALAVARAFVVAYAASTIGMMFGDDGALLFGLVQLGFACALAGILGLRGHDEKRLAIAITVLASVETLWFVFVAAPPDGMIGGQLSLLAAAGTVAGSILWQGEIARREPPPATPPPARVV